MKRKSARSKVARPSKRENIPHSYLGGILLITIGLYFFVKSSFPHADLVSFWPVILILVGLAMLWDHHHK